MEKKDHHNKYLKFLFNQTTEKENEMLLLYLQEDESGLQNFAKTKEVLEAYEKENTDTSFVQKDLKSLKGKIKRKKTFTIGKQLLRYAAILVIAIGLVEVWDYVVLNNELVKYNQIVVARGEQSKIILSDSTVVWLASDTRLEFPDHFVNNERKVLLTGQAFFKVAHNKKLPFIVEAGDTRINVLGTEFNVKAYPSDLEIETSLVRGKVNVTYPTANSKLKSNKMVSRGEKLTYNKKKRNVSLQAPLKRLSKVIIPGEKLSYNKKTHLIRKSKFDPQLELSWREGRLSFRNESFGNIAKKLERFYNVEIEFQNEKIKSYQYTGDFDKESIQEALDAITKITHFRYDKKDRKIIIRP